MKQQISIGDRVRVTKTASTDQYFLGSTGVLSEIDSGYTDIPYNVKLGKKRGTLWVADVELIKPKKAVKEKKQPKPKSEKPYHYAIARVINGYKLIVSYEDLATPNKEFVFEKLSRLLKKLEALEA